MGANLHIRWLLPIAAAGMSSRDLQVTRWEYMCVCNVCRSVTGPLLLWGLSHISFGLLLLIHKCPNSAQHRGSHAKVAAECTDYGQWPKSGAGIQPSQMSISGLGNFFFIIQSVSTYVSSDSSDSFFFSLFLIKIYTQNFRLHYF